MKPVVKILLTRGDFFLLHYRDRKAAFSPNMWSCFGGSIEKGETIEQAARREVKEEIGISIKDLKSLGRASFFGIDIYLYTAKAIGEPKMLGEGSGYGYFLKHKPLPKNTSSVCREALLRYEKKC